MSSTGGTFDVHVCGFYSFLPTRTVLPYLLYSKVRSIWGSLLAAGNMPPIAATSTQQCRGCTVKAWKRLPVRRLEGAECSVSFGHTKHC